MDGKTDRATVGPRRPIPAREARLSKAVTRRLVAHGIGANAISIAGLVFALLAGLVLAFMPAGLPWSFAAWLLVALLVELRLLANMFDGMVAIESRSVSKHGELYNELPDRFSDIAVLVGLGYAPGGDVVLGYGAALAAVLTAYIRAAGTAAGAPPVYCGPMAKPHRMHVVAASAVVSAVTTVLGWTPDAALGSRSVPTLGLLIITIGAGLTCLRRVARIARALG